MRLVDSHIHLDFAAFDADREALLQQANSAGIEHFVVPATTRPSWVTLRSLATERNDVSVAYGIHPYFIADHSMADVTALDRWLETSPATAIGEIGLDFYLQSLNRARQIELFEAQLAVAKKHGLPVILHARKAVEEVSLRLKKNNLSHGIVHSYNGSYEQACRLLELGFKLGFGGALTYSRAHRLHALVKRLPPDAICLETDAPDQPAARFRGRRNEPLALLEVLDVVARLRSEPAELIAAQTAENTYAALNIC